MRVDNSPFNPQEAMARNAGKLDRICIAKTKDGHYALPVRWSPEADLNVTAVKTAGGIFPQMYQLLQYPNTVDATLTYYLQLLYAAGYP